MNPTDFVYIGNLSPRRKRVARRWFARFCAGAVRFDGSDMEDIDAPHEIAQELCDATSYAELLFDQLAEVQTVLRSVKR